MPGPIKEDNGRRPVTCDRCGRVWWVDYSEATKLMQSGKAWVAYRQERQGEVDHGDGALGNTPGKFENVAYLKGVCENCDRGIIRPAMEWESAHIARRARHFARLVDPENAVSYAIEEYEAEYRRTFQPEYAEWLREHPAAINPFAEVDFSLLPEEFKGDEPAYAPGRVGCMFCVDWGVQE